MFLLEIVFKFLVGTTRNIFLCIISININSHLIFDFYILNRNGLPTFKKPIGRARPILNEIRKNPRRRLIAPPPPLTKIPQPQIRQQQPPPHQQPKIPRQKQEQIQKSQKHPVHPGRHLRLRDREREDGGRPEEVVDAGASEIGG